MIISYICYELGIDGQIRIYNSIEGVNIDATQIFIMSASNGILSINGLIFPLLSVIPFSVIYLHYKKVGFLNIVHTKMSKKHLAMKFLIKNAFIGGLTLFVPAFIFIVRLWLELGTARSEYIAVTISYMENMSYENPVIYLLILVVQIFICGAVFATLGLGISVWVNNYFLALILPFCYCIFSAMVPSSISPSFSALAIYSMNVTVANPIIVYLHAVFVFCMGVYLFLKGIDR